MTLELANTAEEKAQAPIEQATVAPVEEVKPVEAKTPVSVATELLAAAKPIHATNGMGTEFSSFTIPAEHEGIKLDEALARIDKAYLPVPMPGGQLLNEHGMPSSHKRFDYKKQPFVRQTEKGDYEVTLLGKYEAFPAEELKTALAAAEQQQSHAR